MRKKDHWQKTNILYSLEYYTPSLVGVDRCSTAELYELVDGRGMGNPNHTMSFLVKYSSPIASYGY